LRRSALLRAACADVRLVALAGGYVLAAALLIVGGLPEPHRTTLFWAVQFPGDLLFFVSALTLYRRRHDDRRVQRFWRLLTLSGAAFITADLLRTAQGLAGLETTEPGAVQLTCFAVGQAAIVVALAGYPMVIGAGPARQRFLLDTAIVLAGAGAAIWFLLTDPRATSATSSGVISGLVIGAGVLLVGFTAVKLVLSGHSPVSRPAAAVMIAAAVVQVVQTAVLPIYAPPLSRGLSLAVLLLPTALLAAGPRLEVLRLRVDPQAREETRRRPYSLLPYAVVAAAQVLLLAALALDGELTLRSWGMLVAMGLVTGLVVVRQLLSVSENARLIGQLDQALLEARELQEQLRHQAEHDVLTQLANRRLFTERLTAAAERPGPDAGRVALLAIDLDGFKPINDTHGHHVGDAVLVAVGERIRRSVRASDTAARLGGDEFAVLMPGATRRAAERLAARIEAVLAEPIAIGPLLLNIGASVGVAVGSADDPEALMRGADAAMYAVKHGRRPTDLTARGRRLPD